MLIYSVLELPIQCDVNQHDPHCFASAKGGSPDKVRLSSCFRITFFLTENVLTCWDFSPQHQSPVVAFSRECNRRQQVVGVLNEFYVATYLYVYQLWKSQQKTIADSGFVLRGKNDYILSNINRNSRNSIIFMIKHSYTVD